MREPVVSHVQRGGGGGGVEDRACGESRPSREREESACGELRLQCDHVRVGRGARGRRPPPRAPRPRLGPHVLDDIAASLFPPPSLSLSLPSPLSLPLPLPLPPSPSLALPISFSLSLSLSLSPSLPLSLSLSPSLSPYLFESTPSGHVSHRRCVLLAGSRRAGPGHAAGEGRGRGLGDPGGCPSPSNSWLDLTRPWTDGRRARRRGSESALEGAGGTSELIRGGRVTFATQFSSNLYVTRGIWINSRNMPRLWCGQNCFFMPRGVAG